MSNQSRPDELDLRLIEQVCDEISLLCIRKLRPKEIHTALMMSLVSLVAANATNMLGASVITDQEKHDLTGDLCDWCAQKHDEIMARHQNRN